MRDPMSEAWKTGYSDFELDFADATTRARYPSHGWAANTQGVRVLWLPLTRILMQTRSIREERGAAPADRKVMQDAMAYADTERKLVQTLRDLHRIEREIPHPARRDDEADYLRHAAGDVVPRLVDSAYVYLRRLADVLAAASRPLLFKHYQSAPMEYKTLRKAVDRLDAWEPICDGQPLAQALNDHSEWYDQLTARGEGELKGTRDAMEHRPVYSVFMQQLSGAEPSRNVVTLGSGHSDVDAGVDLILPLRDVVADLCGLLDGISTATGVAGDYEIKDCRMIIGEDVDTTGFWPEIGA